MDFSDLQEMLDQKFYRVASRDWLVVTGIFLAAFVGMMLLRRILLRRLKKHSHRRVVGLIVEILKATHFIFFVGIALYLSTLGIKLPLKYRGYINQAFVVALLFQIAFWGKLAINLYVQRYRERSSNADGASVMSMNLIGFIARWILYSLITLMVFDNLGIDITALVAGLGVGGIAVALAAQNLLKDFFASVAIMFDKPFVIGDFIVVDNFRGKVEAIGVKTTRIRSISGEQIILPNSNIIESRIRNYKRRELRRIEFKFGVLYQTSLEQLRMIPEYIEQIIHKYPKTRLDYAHLAHFADSELTYEVAYFVLDSDYNVYANVHQSIMLDLIKRFRDEKVEFAFAPKVPAAGASTS